MKFKNSYFIKLDKFKDYFRKTEDNIKKYQMQKRKNIYKIYNYK